MVWERTPMASEKRRRVKTCGTIVWWEKNFIIRASNRVRRAGRGVAVARKDLVPFPVVRLSTHIEVSRKTHLTFFVSKENYPTCNAALRPQIAE